MCKIESNVVLALGCALSLVIVGCKCDSTIPAEELATAAWKTHANYIKAVNAGEVAASSNIPESCWTDAIKAFGPVRVYTHRVNIVVVEKISDGIEEGRYINIPISSYLPQDGDDGFTFTSRDGSVYRYTRDTGYLNE